MSRADRMVTDQEEMIRIVDSCQVIRVAMHDGDGIYLIPMNFGYTWEDGELIFYLHGALEGKKIELLRRCSRVAFELDTEHELVEGKVPCQYGFKFASVVGEGDAVLVEEPKEKAKALTILMKNVSGKDFTFDERLVSIVSVIKLKASCFTGRRRS